MKQNILLLAFVSLSTILFAQDIPNASFETWGIYNTWTLEPESWQTVNSQLLELVTIDSNAYVGNKAMRVTGLPLTEPVGYARVGIPLTSIPESLGFYVRTESIGFPYFSVGCKFYYQGNLIEEQLWDTASSINSWTYQELVFENTLAMVDSASIRVEAVMGDFVQAEGWISVDGFGFSGVNAIDEQATSELLVYPNPSKGFVNIDKSKAGSTIRIYNSGGQLVCESNAEHVLDLRHLSKGIYHLELIDNEKIYTQKLVLN